jgi:hypothetical protein
MVDVPISYTYSIIDNMTPALQRINAEQQKVNDDAAKMNGTTPEAKAAIPGAENVEPPVSGDAAAASAVQKELTDNTNKATVAVDKQTLSMVAQVTAVTAVYRGLNMLSGSMTELGIISEEDAKKFNDLNAAVGLVVGTFQLFKGIVYIVQALQAAEVGLASVETYRSVLASKGTTALVAAVGIGAAAGVGGYFLGQQSSQQTTVNQTVNFAGQSNASQRQTAYETLDILGG